MLTAILITAYPCSKIAKFEGLTDAGYQADFMKILSVLSKSPFPAHDGGTLASTSLLRLLQKNGHELTAFVFSTAKHPFQAEHIPPELAAIDFIPVSLNTLPGISGGFLNLFTRNSYHLQRFYDAEVAFVLSEVIEDRPFDLILLDGLFSAPYLPLIRRETAAPVILRTHNIEHEIWKRYSDDTGNFIRKMYISLQARRLSREERSILCEVDAILAISERDARIIRTFTPKALPVETLPFAMDLSKYEWTEAMPAGQRIGHIGAMDWLPNREGMDWFKKEVWPRIRKEAPEAELLLAGRGMEASSQAENGVSELGEVDDARAFMRSLNVFAVPLFSGSGLRIKILEAMALGIPVVATSMAAEAIDAQNGREIMLADRAEDFADAVLGIGKNPLLAGRIRREARSLVERQYAAETLAPRLEKFLNKFNA